jgi:hypothetical protein
MPLARAAASDAGNRSMRVGGRTAWSEDDYSAACEEFNRLWPETPHGDEIPIPGKPDIA